METGNDDLSLRTMKDNRLRFEKVDKEKFLNIKRMVYKIQKTINTNR